MARRQSAEAVAPPPRKRPAARKRAEPAAVAAEPFVPETVEVAAVALWNVAYRRRLPWQVMLGGRTISFAFAPVPPSHGEGVIIGLSIAGWDASLWVPRSLAEDILATLPPWFDAARLTPPGLAMLCEFALLPVIAALEEQLRCGIMLTSLQAGTPDERREPWLGVTIDGDDGTSLAGRLWLPADEGVALFAAAGDAAMPDRLFADLPSPVSVRLAATTVPAADLASLRAGDVVLVDVFAGPQAAAVLVAEHLVAPAHIEEAGIVLTGPLQPAAGSTLEWCRMDMGQRQAFAEEETTVDMVPVHVVFELGRLEVPLGELEMLAPGAVLPLSRPVAGEVDVLANGRRIGRGVMVKIGDGIGVRISRLAGHG